MSTSVPAQPLAGRAFVRAVVAQAWMELRLLVRSGESLIITFGIPLGLLGFFSQVDVLPTGGVDTVEFLVPGVLAISVIATGMVAVPIQTAFERKYGVLKRLGATPLPAAGFLMAKSLAVTALVAVQTTLIILLAVALGWSPVGWVMVPFVLLLGTVTATSVGLLIAGTLRAETTLALTNALFLVLLMISGVAFDADTLPDAIAAVGAWLPLGALAIALRGVLTGTGVALGSVVVLALTAALAAAAASRLFRWEP